jgi:hypothetical protein
MNSKSYEKSAVTLLIMIAITIIALIAFAINQSTDEATDTRLYEQHLKYAKRYYSINDYHEACYEAKLALRFAVGSDIDYKDLKDMQSIKNEYCEKNN